jgi:hypothetical protein
MQLSAEARVGFRSAGRTRPAKSPCHSSRQTQLHLEQLLSRFRATAFSILFAMRGAVETPKCVSVRDDVLHQPRPRCLQHTPGESLRPTARLVHVLLRSSGDLSLSRLFSLLITASVYLCCGAARPSRLSLTSLAPENNACRRLLSPIVYHFRTIIACLRNC